MSKLRRKKMSNLFAFFSDAKNYQDRMVDRYQKGNLFISTAAVSDGQKPYETAICHPKYNHNKHVIVESYNTSEEAQVGHNKWLKTMLANNLPNCLADCCNATVSQIIQKLEGDMAFEKGSD